MEVRGDKQISSSETSDFILRSAGQTDHGASGIPHSVSSPISSKLRVPMLLQIQCSEGVGQPGKHLVSMETTACCQALKVVGQVWEG